MVVDYEDVEHWFGFTVDATGLDYPDQSTVTNYLSSAEDDFEAYTEKTFDSGDKKHLLLLKMLLELQLKQWYKIRADNGESRSNPAGSVSHQNNWIYYSKTRFDSLIKRINPDLNRQIPHFGGDLIDNGYDDR